MLVAVCSACACARRPHTHLTLPPHTHVLQVHESELMKMRNLFARKAPTPPAVICYADATFRQIASFAQLHVQVGMRGLA